MTHSEQIQQVIHQLSSIQVPVGLTAEITVPLYNSIGSLRQICLEMKEKAPDENKNEAESNDDSQSSS